MDLLGQLVRTSLPEVDPDPRLDAAAEALLVTRISRGDARPRSPSNVRRGVIGALAVAAVIALVFVVKPEPRLQYAVEGSTTTETGYVRAATGEAAVSFSDGSRLALAPGAVARVAEVTANGARVLVEDGRVDVRVVPASGSRWSFEAGPFAVQVTGTAFAIEWRARDQVLDVSLREGSVIVRGPMEPAGVPLTAGRRLVTDARTKELRILPLTAEPTASASVAASPSEPAEPAHSADADPSAAAPPAAPAPTWAQRVASGDFAGVMAEADSRGISSVLASAPLADLVALGDAARYAGRSDVARQALLATRQRFPGTSHARTAAFLLGRMADDAGSTAAALEWFDHYLAEAPGGSFAAEALGRKMVAVKRSRGADAARAIAEEYIRRFPKGGHAKIAGQILSGSAKPPLD